MKKTGKGTVSRILCLFLVEEFMKGELLQENVNDKGMNSGGFGSFQPGYIDYTCLP
ncbi:hypothetical protein D3C75_1211860 [compost metagenome]